MYMTCRHRVIQNRKWAYETRDGKVLWGPICSLFLLSYACKASYSITVLPGLKYSTHRISVSHWMFSIYQQLSYAQEVLQETFSSTSPCVRSTEDMHVLQLVWFATIWDTSTCGILQTRRSILVPFHSIPYDHFLSGSTSRSGFPRKLMDSYTSHEWHCSTKLYGPAESFTGIGLCSPLFHKSWFRPVGVATGWLASSVFIGPDHVFLLLCPVLCFLVLLLNEVPQNFPCSCCSCCCLCSPLAAAKSCSSHSLSSK